MGIPDRPNQVDQLDGSFFAGVNCTCAGGAMAVDRQTIGRIHTTAAKVRQLTGDRSGGTTLRQVADALWRGWGIRLDVQTPMHFDKMEQRIHVGEGAIIQGRESVYRGTRFSSSEVFGGNHATFLNEGRGWSLGKDGLYHAEEFLIFNPLADGRRKGIAKSPYWVPRHLVVEWAGKLDVSSSSSYNPLGQGQVFAAFTRDTEPHFHSKHGGRATSPFPDHQIVHRPSGSHRPVKIRRSPSVTSEVLRLADPGELFIAYQFVTNGDVVQGSRRWYGTHGGGGWIHSSKVRKEGGDS